MSYDEVSRPGRVLPSGVDHGQSKVSSLVLDCLPFSSGFLRRQDYMRQYLLVQYSARGVVEGPYGKVLSSDKNRPYMLRGVRHIPTGFLLHHQFVDYRENV